MSPHAADVLCTQIAPRIRAAIPGAVNPIGAEDHEELIQDTIATAAAMLHRGEAAKKTVTPGNVAYYALKLAKAGRRSTGSSKADVMHPGTQLAGRASLASLDEPIGSDEMGDSFTLGDVLADDREDPSIMAARKLDWGTFLARQTKRGRALLAVVAEGGTMRDVARQVGVSDSGFKELNAGWQWICWHSWVGKSLLKLASSQCVGITLWQAGRGRLVALPELMNMGREAWRMHRKTAA